MTAFEQVCRMSVGECIDAAHGKVAKAFEVNPAAAREWLAGMAEAEASRRKVTVGEVLAGWVCDGVERGAAEG